MKKKRKKRIGLRRKVYRKLKEWVGVEEGQRAPWFLLMIRILLFPLESYTHLHPCAGIHYNFASDVYMFDLPGRRGSVIITGEEFEKILEDQWTTQYIYDPLTKVAIDDGDFRSFPDIKTAHSLKEKK